MMKLPLKAHISWTRLWQTRLVFIPKWIRMWQEPLIWLPLLLLLLWLADWLLPQIDSDAGIDGPGFLYGLVQAMIAFAVAGFVAWIAQRTYGVSLSEEREEEVLGECRKGKVGSMFVIALPWIQWFLVFYLMWDKMA